MMEDNIMVDIYKAVAAGKAGAAELVTHALKEGLNAERIISEDIEVGLEEIEEKYQRHEIYLPEVLLVKRAVEGCMTALGSKVTAELEERVRRHFDRLQSLCVTCRPMKLWDR